MQSQFILCQSLGIKIKQSQQKEMKVYEQSQRAHEHYRRILSAKSSIPPRQRKRSLCLRSDPMKQYEFRSNNNKLVGKLKQIYDEPSQKYEQRQSITVGNRQKSTQRKGSLINAYKKRQYQSIIDEQNLKMVNRIMTAKSTITGFKERKQQLKKYSRITMRSLNTPHRSRQDSLLYSQFKKQLLSSSNQNTRSGNQEKKKRKKRRKLVNMQTIQ